MFLFSEAGKIQVYVRVRPFTEKEKEKREANAIEIHQEHSLVRLKNMESKQYQLSPEGEVNSGGYIPRRCIYPPLFTDPEGIDRKSVV